MKILNGSDSHRTSADEQKQSCGEHMPLTVCRITMCEVCAGQEDSLVAETDEEQAGTDLERGNEARTPAHHSHRLGCKVYAVPATMPLIFLKTQLSESFSLRAGV